MQYDERRMTMLRFFALFTFLCLMSPWTVLASETYTPSQAIVDQVYNIPEIELTPPPIDYYALNRIWGRLVKELNVPSHVIPPPIVLDWDVPIQARMGFQWPSKKYPNYRMQISVAPRTIDLWNDALVSFGIGHELLHYILIMRENGYNTKNKVFENTLFHHCNEEFKRLQKVIAETIWNIYHSSSDRSRMHDEIIKSCGKFGNQ